MSEKTTQQLVKEIETMVRQLCEYNSIPYPEGLDCSLTIHDYSGNCELDFSLPTLLRKPGVVHIMPEEGLYEEMEIAVPMDVFYEHILAELKKETTGYNYVLVGEVLSLAAQPIRVGLRTLDEATSWHAALEETVAEYEEEEEDAYTRSLSLASKFREVYGDDALCDLLSDALATK